MSIIDPTLEDVLHAMHNRTGVVVHIAGGGQWPTAVVDVHGPALEPYDDITEVCIRMVVHSLTEGDLDWRGYRVLMHTVDADVIESQRVMPINSLDFNRVLRLDDWIGEELTDVIESHIRAYLL